MKGYLLLSVMVALSGCGVAPTALPPTAAQVTAPATAPNQRAAVTETPFPPAARTAPETPPEESTMQSLPTPASPLATPPAAAEQAVTLAREDLAGRLTSAAEAAQLVSVEAVDWPDASLGCPQPGMLYAQVVTPGYRIVLTAAGQRYEYHSDSGQGVVYCQPAAARPAPGSAETESVRLAMQDLARRTGVSVDDIQVLAVIGQEFSAAAFDCRPSKARIARDEAPAVVHGQAILLKAAGRRYEYHASGEKVVFCRELR